MLMRNLVTVAEGYVSTDIRTVDAKQARVILYIVLSILPVLALIPFFLSREFLPADMTMP
jgi:hypothetical protein